LTGLLDGLDRQLPPSGHSTSRSRASYALFGPAGKRRRWSRGRRISLSADHRNRLRTTCGIILFDRPSEDALVFAQ
jgi:hypothetical protein